MKKIEKYIKTQIETHFFNFIKLVIKMKPKFHIVKRAHYRVWIWFLLLLVARYLFFTNAQFWEEFTGWINIWIKKEVDNVSLKQSIGDYMQSIGYTTPRVIIESVGWWETKIKVNARIESDEKVADLSKNIQSLLVTKWFITNTSDITSQSIIWPSVWSFMEKSARNAIVVWLIFMAVYMLISFAAIRKSISPAILAIITIFTMIFDISIPAWAYWLWMMISPTVQIDTIFVIAVLTTMWYSINDTIVIFDRIRENLQIKWWTKDIVYGKIFEDSLRQTMRRSFGIVWATLLVVIAMFFLWTWIIKHFAFIIWIWVLAGSYSSIFISAPLAYLMMWRYKKEKAKL